MKLIAFTVLTALAAGPVLAADKALKNPLTDSETWQDLRYDIVGEAEIADGGAVFEVDAPYRAHDAATVPVVIRQTDADMQISKATIVIDENPAPMAAHPTSETCSPKRRRASRSAKMGVVKLIEVTVASGSVLRAK